MSEEIPKCHRCDKKYTYVATKMQIRVPSGDSTWYAVCRDCEESLRFWLYGEGLKDEF